MESGQRAPAPPPSHTFHFLFRLLSPPPTHPPHPPTLTTMALSLTTRPSTLATRRAPASRSAAAPLRVSAPAPGRANARKSPVVAAATTDDGVVAAAKKIGLDPEEGIFGFTPFAEVSLEGRGRGGGGRWSLGENRNGIGSFSAVRSLRARRQGMPWRARRPDDTVDGLVESLRPPQ